MKIGSVFETDADRELYLRGMVTRHRVKKNGGIIPVPCTSLEAFGTEIY